MLKVMPSIAQLRALIAKVPKYPITAHEIVELAMEENTDPAVVEFYQAFPADEIFDSKEDLLTRTEQLAIMNEEERDQPQEYWRAPEED